MCPYRSGRPTSKADRIRAAARAKADATLADAEIAASKPYAAACAAVLRLRQLVDTNAELAGLCGIRPDEVSEMLAQARQHPPEPPPQAAHGTAGMAGAANGATAAPGDGAITGVSGGTDDGGLAAGDHGGRSG